MGKTFSTGLLTDGISQDSSNNIGIGVAPSGTNKFEVSGSTKLNGNALMSGSLTISSSANAIILPAGQTIGLGTAQIYTGTGGNSGNIFIQGAQTKLYADKVVLEAATAAGVEVIGGTKLSGSLIVSGSATTIGATTLSGSLNVSGSITSTSTITAQTLVVQTITSSVLYSSGSNIFGNSLSNTQVMTGSVGITGSLTLNNVSVNTGTGTTSYLPKFTGTSTLGNSAIYDAGGYGGFNNTGVATRTFVIQATSGRNIALEVIESANVHAIYLSPNSSGYNRISSDYMSGGVFLPLSLSGRENNSDLVLQTNGNVGIGTTSPDRPFDIYSASSVGIARIRGNNSNGAAITIQNDENLQAISIYAAGSSGFGIGGWAGNSVLESGTGIVYSAYNGNHIFQSGVSGRTERMRITSGGNVGIGTTSPQSQLHMNGVLTFTEAGYDTARLHTITHAHSAGSNPNNYIGFNVSDGSGTTAERMRINGAGNATISGALTMTGTITNLGTGTDTYTQSTWYIDTSNQILFENGRQTNSADGTGRTVYFTWRGGPSVGGGVQLQHGTNAWAAYTSDARLKTKVADIKNGVEAIMKLNPIKFKWTRELENSRTVTGFTAQNIEEAIPDAVFNSWQDKELGDVKSYYQDYLTPYLVKAIQELSTKNDALQSQINELKNN